jgi:hypothetical protein
VHQFFELWSHVTPLVFFFPILSLKEHTHLDELLRGEPANQAMRCSRTVRLK